MGAILRGSSRVTSKGQITIPQDIRNEYHIHPGDIIYFIIDDATITIRKGPLEIAS